MFRQRKGIDIYIGDDCDTVKQASRNMHLSHSFMNLFKKKTSKKEPCLKRVKSANIFVAQESVINADREDASVLCVSSASGEMRGSLSRTKSMPNMTKNVDNSSTNNAREFKKNKSVNKLKDQEERKQLQELVKYLHTDTPIVTYKQKMDNDDIELVRHLDHCVDLNKYFEENMDDEKDTFWKSKMKYVSNELNNKSLSNCEDHLSENGFRLVRRFGFGIPDGCGFPLSLKKEDTTDKGQNVEWPQILEEAEQTFHMFENFNKNVRRGSLLQPRIMFISFYPANGWQKVKEIGHCLPLRKWTSELLFESKEAAELLDADCKRHLKWNASIGNIQQWMSFISNDKTVFTAKNMDRKAEQPLITFRRQSFNEKVWNANDLLLQKKIDYTKKVKLFMSQCCNTNEIRISEIGKRSRLQSIFISTDNTSARNMSQIEQLTPNTIAETLTAIVRDLFLKINENEICELLLRPNLIDEESCSGVSALLGFQKRIINLLTSSVLEMPTVTQRAKRIALFIEIAEQLSHIHNWHSMFSVICSCQSPPIARLKQTWNYLSKSYSDHFHEFLHLSKLLTKNLIQSKEESCIPIFDYWLRDLKARCDVKANEANNKGVRGHWQNSETIAVWLDSEIISLEQLASKQVHSTYKNADRIKKRSFIQRLKKNFSHKSGQSLQTEPTVNAVGTNVQSANANQRQNFCPTKPIDYSYEEIVISEATAILNEYRNKVVAYQLSDNDKARNFLLLQPYKTMQENMSHSYEIEPPNNSKIMSN